MEGVISVWSSVPPPSHYNSRPPNPQPPPIITRPSFSPGSSAIFTPDQQKSQHQHFDEKKSILNQHFWTSEYNWRSITFRLPFVYLHSSVLSLSCLSSGHVRLHTFWPCFVYLQSTVQSMLCLCSRYVLVYLQSTVLSLFHLQTSGYVLSATFLLCFVFLLAIFCLCSGYD